MHACTYVVLLACIVGSTPKSRNFKMFVKNNKNMKWCSVEMFKEITYYLMLSAHVLCHTVLEEVEVGQNSTQGIQYKHWASY